jgi:hypothetical protein
MQSNPSNPAVCDLFAGYSISRHILFSRLVSTETSDNDLRNLEGRMQGVEKMQNTEKSEYISTRS